MTIPCGQWWCDYDDDDDDDDYDDDHADGLLFTTASERATESGIYDHFGG